MYPTSTTKSYGGAYAGFDYDQMDRLYFPTSGWTSRLAYFNSPSEGYSKIFASLGAAHAFGEITCSTPESVTRGPVKGSLPAYDAATLGGFNELSGFAQNQLSGDDVSYAGLHIEKIIGRLPMGLRGDMRAGV